jgi:hypothetical protein
VQVVRQQEAEKDALGAVHPFRRVQEQSPRRRRYILLRIIAFGGRLRGTGKLLRQNALKDQRSEVGDQRSATDLWNVGWVERSETHRFVIFVMSIDWLWHLLTSCMKPSPDRSPFDTSGRTKRRSW